MNRTRKRALRVVRKTWRDAFGDRPMPPVWIGKLPGGGAGEYRNATGIGIARSTAKSLASKKPMRRKFGQVTFVHEGAHAEQRHPATNTHVGGEGAAQAFAVRYGKKNLGLTARDFKRKGQRAYKGAVGRARKRYGMGYVTRGQFRP